MSWPPARTFTWPRATNTGQSFELDLGLKGAVVQVKSGDFANTRKFEIDDDAMRQLQRTLDYAKSHGKSVTYVFSDTASDIDGLRLLLEKEARRRGFDLAKLKVVRSL